MRNLVKAKPKVYVTSRSFGRYCKGALELVRQVADVESNPYGRIMTRNEILKIVETADGIIGNEEFDREILDRAKKLKIICRHGQIGAENLDLSAATEKGIVVTDTPGVYAESVADFTIGLIICLYRKIPQAHLSTKNGMWETQKFLGRNIYGKTIGIIGLGTIGVMVANRASGFNMRILAYDPYTSKEKAEKVGAEAVSLEKLLRESDIVTIHTPFTAETRNLIGKHELGLMKPESVLIMTATGGIVDEGALYEALKDRKILGAALDVYIEEPPGPNFPLFGLDNVIATPHIASYTFEAMQKMDMMNAEDIVKFFKGEKPTYVANPSVLERVKLK